MSVRELVLASYAFDGNGNDGSGNDLHLTEEGAPSYDGGVVTLDGTADAFSRSSGLTLLDNLGALTIAGRCYLESVDPLANQTLCMIQCAGVVPVVARLFYVGQDDALAFEIVNSLDAAEVVEIATPPLQTFFDVRGWIDPDSGEVGIQIDGDPAVTGAATSVKQVAATALLVGRRGSAIGAYWYGQIDALTLAARVWSAEEWAQWRAYPQWPFVPRRCPATLSVGAGRDLTVSGGRSVSVGSGRGLRVTC